MKKGIFLLAGLALAAGRLPAQTVLDSVVVTATRAGSKTPVAQTTIYQKEIDERRTGRELPFVLEQLPSIVSHSDNGSMMGSTGFRIRGTDASRINISIDGVPLNDAESQAVFWVNTPNLSAVGRSLQVQRGVGTTAFGSSAFGGLLNIETRPATGQPEASFETAYGSFNTWTAAARAATGLLHDAVAFDARYEYLSSDGYLERSGLWQQTLYLNGRWQGRRQQLRASVLYGEQHTQLTFDGVPFEQLSGNRRLNMSGAYNDTTDFYPNETDNYRQLHAHLHYTRRLGSAWKLNATAYYTKGKGYYEQYKEDRRLADYGLPDQQVAGTVYAESDLIRQKGLDNDFYGLHTTALYHAHRLQLTLGAAASRYDGGHYGKVTWTAYNAGTIPYNYDWYRNTGRKDEYSVFAKAAYDLLPALSLFADAQLRGVHFGMHGLDDDYYEKQLANPADPLAGVLNERYHWLFFNPKIGLTYTPNDRHQAFVSFAVGNREPNRSDLKDADRHGIRTPAKSERLYDWEAGYTFRPAFGQFGVTLYYMDYRDQIVSTGRVNDAYRPIMENVPESYRAGIELTAAARLHRQLQLEGALTLSRNRLKDYTNYVDEYDNPDDWGWQGQRAEYFRSVAIAYSPDVIASASVRYRPLDDGWLYLTGKHVGAQYFDNTASSTRRLDGYFVVNLTAHYDFAVARKVKGFIELAVHNLFNRQYSTGAFINYRAAFADGSPDSQELRCFPQAGMNGMVKVGVQF